MRWLSTVLLLGAIATGTVGCGVSTPTPPTAAEATGRETCGRTADGERHAPLVVDLQPEKRADLEVALRRGLVVTRFDCRSMEVLPRCRAEGVYDYAGTAPKEQLVRMTDERALRATLPLTGPELAARLGGEFSRGTSLDLALVMVGKLTATTPVLSKDQLLGECAGATHVVHSATLGAFALKTGAASRAETVVSVFGAGVDASKSAERTLSARDGQLDLCRAATSTNQAAPEGCNAALRLELLEIREPPPPISVLTEAQAAPLRGKVCPDPAQCEAECDGGQAKACAHWGTILTIGDRVPRDLGKASRAFQRACELDDMGACTLLGVALLTRGNARADADRGRAVLERPCERGQPQACATLGLSFESGGDPARAADYLKRACELGHTPACR